MSSGSSSFWWDGWHCTYHGSPESSTSEPRPHELASDEQVMNAINSLHDCLQQTLALTQKRSHKTQSERTASLSKGNAAYAAMEAVNQARDWQEEAKRLYDQKIAEAADTEEIYQDASKRTLEKTEALEKHVKTVTMRADSLAATEGDFFQALLERQEEAMQEFKVLDGQLCQSRPTHK